MSDAARKEAIRIFNTHAPFIKKINGGALNKIICEYYGACHGVFVETLLDLYINTLKAENEKLREALERAEEALREISTSTTKVGYYIHPTWEASRSLVYFKNKKELGET